MAPLLSYFPVAPSSVTTGQPFVFFLSEHFQSVSVLMEIISLINSFPSIVRLAIILLRLPGPAHDLFFLFSSINIPVKPHNIFTVQQSCVSGKSAVSIL